MLFGTSPYIYIAVNKVSSDFGGRPLAQALGAFPWANCCVEEMPLRHRLACRPREWGCWLGRALQRETYEIHPDQARLGVGGTLGRRVQCVEQRLVADGDAVLVDAPEINAGEVQ